MNNKIKKIILFPLLGLAGLGAILGPIKSHFVKVMPSLIVSQVLFAEEENISVSVKSLTPEESERYLKSDVCDLGYLPVQITIENQSTDPYLIDTKSISLPTTDAKKIAQATQHSSLPVSIGLRVASFIFWPFSIPSAMQGIKSLQNYQKIKRDLLIKSVKEEIIPPYTIMNRVFFVKMEDFKDSFSVTLINQETLESKIFSITHLKETPSPALDPIPMPVENYYLTHEK